ncbi:pseudouridine synthase [Oleiagrimonas sp. C23AA]|uniref:pseudouridine synthase n=1 Tax=Oleiagrimonas sp. C23AA TaxID=2719047 RepID=UPI00141E183E|nr:pseudouridine synthase [Oleiagrimonas sp. C23AA]NII09612.1 rRNA pseudouridine synthase [Oleiagrimonas sp. C23AA]
MKLLRLIANLGYGSRKQVTALFGEGRITDVQGQPLYADDVVDHGQVRLDGEPLDPAPGMVLMLNKPTGFTCSHKDAGRLVYGLLPPRFAHRKPVLSSVGRLDRDTSGLLLFTDDGALLHRIISPKKHVPKTYEAVLAEPLCDSAEATFASGTLMLEGESTPLAPAKLERMEPKRVRVTVSEGRYHQVRRMFAALGNHVTALHRLEVGALTLGALEEGQWRLLGEHDIAQIFAASP